MNARNVQLEFAQLFDAFIVAKTFLKTYTKELFGRLGQLCG